LASIVATEALLQGINFLHVTLEHDRHLTAYFEEWSRRFNEESDPRGTISSHEGSGYVPILGALDPASLFRCSLLPL
jgi:hypothetical protein